MHDNNDKHKQTMQMYVKTNRLQPPPGNSQGKVSKECGLPEVVGSTSRLGACMRANPSMRIRKKDYSLPVWVYAMINVSRPPPKDGEKLETNGCPAPV